MFFKVHLYLMRFLFLFNSGPPVAFTVVLSRNTHVSGHAVVKYDSVLTNVGRAYSPSTGIFTVPHKGIYTISCSLLGDASNSVLLEIKKNGRKMAKVYSASGTHPHSAQILQLLLNEGDEIWIQNSFGHTAKFHDHGSYNTFSAALIARL